MMLKSLLLLCVVATSCVHSAKIVAVFPYPSKSHWILGSALLKELANRGHEVTMISSFPLNKPHVNYKDVDLPNVRKMMDEQKDEFVRRNSAANYAVTRFLGMINSFRMMIDEVIADKNLHEYLDSNPEADVVIHMNLLTDSLLGIGHKLKAPTILFSLVGSNFFLDYYTGCSAPYSYVPNFLTGYSDEMNFWQRLSNTFTTIAGHLIYHFVNIPYQNEILQKHFPGAPHVSELIENIDLVLVNANVATESAKPYLPNMIQIGGFQMQGKEEMPKDLQTYMNNSKHGVVYFCLGSNMKSSELPPDAIKAILDTFSESKYDILWKFEKDLPNKPKNVRIQSWLPQKAILSHPKVVAFITHAGFGGITEATYNGVPMICLPILGDQLKNCKDIVNAGYGIYLDKNALTKEIFGKALKDITTDPKYKETIKARSELLTSQDMNPMDRAVYWVEHVIKHKGGKHLRSRSATLPWYQYHLLDVIAFASGVAILTISLLVFVIKKLVGFLCKKKPQVAQKKKVKTN